MHVNFQIIISSLTYFRASLTYCCPSEHIKCLVSLSKICRLITHYNALVISLCTHYIIHIILSDYMLILFLHLWWKSMHQLKTNIMYVQTLCIWLEQFGPLYMYSLDDKHPTRPRFEPSALSFEPHPNQISHQCLSRQITSINYWLFTELGLQFQLVVISKLI